MIRITNSDEESTEEYGSVDELKQELKDSASLEYMEAVFARLNAGEVKFAVANGPGDYDYYEVVDG